jgi:hypothetical protein
MAQGRYVRSHAIARLRSTVPQLFLVRLWQQYLTDVGWTRTVRSQIAEDRDGNPLPWLTYSAISLLENRTRNHFRVFEYGCGQSTLWWARRVVEVVAVEHDRGWFDLVRRKAPANAALLHRSLNSPEYASAPRVAGGRFHVVVIDGRNRVACAPFALDALTPNGVIIWDNTERRRYEAGLLMLIDAGMRRVDFTGLGPVNPWGWTTSVLYRDGNCLGL